MANQRLFDKIINIEFVKADGTSDFLKCPDTGQKPNIELRGMFTTDSMANDIELRITNFYPSVPLSQYKLLNITAGYKDSLQTSITGQIWIAYQESPGPDGVTFFQFHLGDFIRWVNVSFQNSYPVGTPLINVFNDIAAAMQMKPIAVDLSDVTLAAPLTFPGHYIKDAIAYLNQCFPYIVIRMDSNYLIMVRKEGKSNNTYSIDIFSSPPQQEAAGWVFNAPWIPNLRPMDEVIINPKFYQQTFVTFNDLDGFTPSASSGGGNPSKQPFTVQKVEFVFDTNGSANSMSVFALTQADKVAPTVTQPSVVPKVPSL